MTSSASSCPDAAAAAVSWPAAALRAAAAAGGPVMAIDTSTAAGSLALAHPGAGRCWEVALARGAQPSADLAARLADLFAAVALAPRDLAGLVVGLGPGSFTGLRVGLATAKGLAMGAGVPLYGASSLALVAAGAVGAGSGGGGAAGAMDPGRRDPAAGSAGGAGRVVVCLDARRGACYAGRYRGGEGTLSAEVPDAATSVTALADALEPLAAAGQPWTLTGDAAATAVAALLCARPGAAAVPAVPAVRAPVPHALAAIALSAAALATGQALTPAGLVPRYLRLSAPEQARIRGQV